jgi:4-hydroxy-tetrahydrodipicolinate reductase
LVSYIRFVKPVFGFFLKGCRMKKKLIVVGAAGRMGRRIAAKAFEAGDFEVCGAVERGGHPDLGGDAGELASVGRLGVEVSDSWPAGADVVVDFSHPGAVDMTLGYCTRVSCPLVLGTTGLSDKHFEAVKRAAGGIAVLYASNMSVGMNVLFSLAGSVASKLGEGWDIEIVERHHRFKKDAPSGSALTIARAVCEATGRDYPGCLVHGRSGRDVLRKEGTIGVHAVRAGDITGEHEVIFSGAGETLVFSHTARSRDIFAAGALAAAQWIMGKPSGLYSMTDVIGI